MRRQRERQGERHQSKTRILTAFDPRSKEGFFFLVLVDEGFS